MTVLPRLLWIVLMLAATSCMDRTGTSSGTTPDSLRRHAGDTAGNQVMPGTPGPAGSQPHTTDSGRKQTGNTPNSGDTSRLIDSSAKSPQSMHK